MTCTHIHTWLEFYIVKYIITVYVSANALVDLNPTKYMNVCSMNYSIHHYLNLVPNTELIKKETYTTNKHLHTYNND